MHFPPVSYKILRKMGYLRDQEGIMRRYIREHENWEAHLRNTCRFVSEAVQKHKGEQVLVLGSGWLIDFPLEDALSHAGSIIMTDVHHPPQIRNKLKHYNNINLVKGDITGGLIEKIYYSVKTGESIPMITRKAAELIPESFPDTGLVISLNILNQLDILLAEYMKLKMRVKEEELVEFRTAVQQNHLSFLINHSYCLICDYKEKIINRKNGEEILKESVYTSLPPGDQVREWEWVFDTRGIYYEQCDTYFEVKAAYKSKTPNHQPSFMSSYIPQ